MLLSNIHLWDGDAFTQIAAGPASDDGSTDPATAATGLGAEYSVVPGIVDTHVHLDTNAATHTVDRSWPLVIPVEERSLHVLRHTLDAAKGGVTSMRDLAAEWSQMAVARALETGAVEGPRFYAGGPVGMTAGHGDLFVPPGASQRYLVADSPDECRKLVRTWARAGAHAIKIYASGGILSMGDKVSWRNQTDAEMSATIDEAHALGMLVAAHAHTAEGITRALDLGADSIEHATGATPEIMARLAEGRIPVSPTLLIHDRIAESAAGVTKEARDKSLDQETEARRADRLREMAEAGVRFVLGTDANGVWTRFGADQLEEARLMAHYFGWSAERLMKAVTSDAADAMGISPKVGRIREGAGADFVVFRGRPWQDVAALDAGEIVAVVSRGRVLAGALPE